MNKNKAWRTAAVLVLLFLVVGSALPAQADFPTPAVPGWKLEALDHQRNFSNFSQKALAFDSINRPHIVYGGDGLYHAWDNGDAFQVEVVDSSVDVGQQASIAIDSSGHIHIAYYDALHGDLKYATNMSGGWTSETVVSDGDVGTETAIFTDSDDVPYILYLDDTNNKLMFISGTMSWPMYWETPEIASVNANFPTEFSAVMKNNREVFVSYGNLTAGLLKELRYAHRSAGVWTDTAVDSGFSQADYVGLHNAIDLDSEGQPWIVYSDNNTSLDLYLVRKAHWNGVYWEISGETDTLYTIAEALAMVINRSNNYLSITYQGEGTTLYYAEWNGSDWVNGFTIETNDTGYRPSIALDSAGVPGVSYYHGPAKALHYRKKVTNTVWSSIVSVDVSQDTGACPVVKLDRWDRPHVIYYDQYFKTLRFKEYGTQWSASYSVAPAREGTLICQGGLALTGAGLPRVAYATQNSLYYAIGSLPFTGFQNEDLVDTSPANWIESVTLVLDSDGSPHIVYVKNSLLYHAYLNDLDLWVIEPVIDSASKTQMYNLFAAPSLAIDASDNLYLAFDYTGLDFIERTSTGWQARQHVSTGSPWNGISLVIVPPLNLPAIAAAYISENGNAEWVGLSRLICFGGCIWLEPEVVNTAFQTDAPNNFTGVSLAADRKGALTLSYLEDDGAMPNGLVVARRVGTHWLNQHIDNQKWAGTQTWLALTASGKARIAYYDGLSKDLRFAWEWDQVYIPRVKK